MGRTVSPFAHNDFEVHHAAESETGHCWIITLRSGILSQSYVLKLRDGFHRDQSPYSIETIGLREVLYEPHRLLGDTEDWRLLARIPSDEASQTSGVFSEQECIDQLSGGIAFGKGLRCNMLYFLAENVWTGELEAVGNASGQNWRGHIHRSLVSLSLPRTGMVYRNVAVANKLIYDVQKIPVIRIAVIWSDKMIQSNKRSELYIYEIPSKLLDDTKLAEPISPHKIQGKRIISLPPYFGGQHPKSLFLRQSSACEPIEVEMLSLTKPLGGLHFSTQGTSSDSRTPQFAKLHIWGPPSHEVSVLRCCPEIQINVFDFSYADPARLAGSKLWVTPLGFKNDTVMAKRRRSRMIGPRMDHCACRLHDEGWAVVLPTRAMPSSNPGSEPSASTILGKGFWSWSLSTTNEEKALPSANIEPVSSVSRLFGRKGPWTWLRSIAATEHDPSTDIGTISKADSRERMEALERREKWVKRRIVGMKCCGMDDLTLRHVWFIADWSGYGVLGKPRGWETLWKQWAKEMGVDPKREQKL